MSAEAKWRELSRPVTGSGPRASSSQQKRQKSQAPTGEDNNEARGARKTCRGATSEPHTRPLPPLTPPQHTINGVQGPRLYENKTNAVKRRRQEQQLPRDVSTTVVHHSVNEMLWECNSRSRGLAEGKTRVVMCHFV